MLHTHTHTCWALQVVLCCLGCEDCTSHTHTHTHTSGHGQHAMHLTRFHSFYTRYLLGRVTFPSLRTSGIPDHSTHQFCSGFCDCAVMEQACHVAGACTVLSHMLTSCYITVSATAVMGQACHVAGACTVPSHMLTSCYITVSATSDHTFVHGTPQPTVTLRREWKPCC